MQEAGFPKPAVWPLAAPRGIRTASGWRVETRIGDQPIGFESADASLRASPEAFAGMFLLPALAHHATVASQAPLDPVWLRSAARVPGLAADWWGYADRFPIDAERASESGPARRPASTALCFTGGVDSFFALRHGDHRPDVLLFVLGFDIRLKDRTRAQAAIAGLHEVAQATGLRARVLSSDARRHRLFRSVDWERTHGAALAAAGHVLGDVGRLIIASTYSAASQHPWGSHPQLDPLWSTSRMRVEHGSRDRMRVQKVAALAADPLAQRHLRVCWENRAPTGNCSRCEKCVHTLVALAATPYYRNFHCFDVRSPLVARIDALAPLPAHLCIRWRHFDALTLPPPVRRAVTRLLVRSECQA